MEQSEEPIMSNEMVTLKDRLAELVANVQNCATDCGVDELEKLYLDKKKAFGKDITPMMDIMVRDAIGGKRKEIESVAKTNAETESAKKAAELEAKKVKKMDENYDGSKIKEVRVIDFRSLMKENIPLSETEINVGVFTFARMNPPTESHVSLMEHMAALAEKVGALPMVYLSHTNDQLRNPLDYKTKVELVSSVAPKSVQVVESELINLFSILESLPNKGFTDLYAICGQDRLSEFERAGRYFLKYGGNSFTVVNSGDRTDDTKSSTYLRQLVSEGDYGQFAAACPHLEDASSLYAQLEEAMKL